jgi:hypothetical protein
MSSSEPPDLLDLERDLPTTAEDIRALRENRPKWSEDWLAQLEATSKAFPQPTRRKTFAGFEPFEL